MAGVEVQVDVGARGELVDRVLDALGVDALRLHLRALGVAEVRDEVREAVRLDHEDDPEVRVLRLRHGGDDRVDVLGLVAGQTLGRAGELAVRGERGAVATGQVVHHAEKEVLALGERRVEVGREAGNCRDPVHPHRLRLLADGAHRGGQGAGLARRLGVRLRGVVRVHVHRGPGERVGELRLRQRRRGRHEEQPEGTEGARLPESAGERLHEEASISMGHGNPHPSARMGGPCFRTLPTAAMPDEARATFMTPKKRIPDRYAGPRPDPRYAIATGDAFRCSRVFHESRKHFSARARTCQAAASHFSGRTARERCRAAAGRVRSRRTARSGSPSSPPTSGGPRGRRRRCPSTCRSPPPPA